MTLQRAQAALRLAKRLQADAPPSYVPPSEGTRPSTHQVLPHAIVGGTRGYLEKIVFQINGCYETGWFDGCAVMMRRLLEVLLIECFEAKGIASKVQDGAGDYYLLGGLVREALAEPTWSLGRETKRALPKLQKTGNRSAHGRRYTAHREDIDRLVLDFRIACQELVYLSGLK